MKIEKNSKDHEVDYVYDKNKFVTDCTVFVCV